MEKISTHQFMTLGAAVLVGTTFLPIPSIVAAAGGRDGWMSVLPGFAAGIPFGLMVLSLMERYPEKNLLHISETILGKWIGKLIGIIYILISGYFGGLLLGQVGDVFQSSIMPLTPISAFLLGGLFLVCYLVLSGIEVFARFSEVVFPLVVIALLLNVSLAVPRIEQGELLPILSEGLKPIFFAGIKVIPYSMNYILFIAGILPFLPTSKQELSQLKAKLWRAVFLAGILDTLVALIELLVFGPTETVRLVYGLLALGKMVEISRTVSGVESLFLVVWLGALIIKIGSCFYVSIWGVETVFGIKGLKLNMAVGIIFLGIAYTFKGPALIQEIAFYNIYLSLPFTSVWIAALWAAARWKKEPGV
ncbi:endospore germination permease [Desulfosporosinus sp. PR]|uniref:GerAB/ArcD/ProY family transporter n=1 Tax=Candidatus Desulfosporosinus nitrosoreducens TaxID=3401928 RepID=UPI0027E6AF49|nr:endospore germination permease [Desulfosporosinus sp. PR]MDQ7096393.1 endospore germination permease [Desulfosporosinus sp. PR]